MHRRQGNGSVKLGSAEAEALPPGRRTSPSSAATGKPRLRFSPPTRCRRVVYIGDNSKLFLELAEPRRAV